VSTPPAVEGATSLPIRLTLSEKAKTVTFVATSATLSTFAEEGQEMAKGHPFGSYVDYILDDKVRHGGGVQQRPGS
jgi:hypothetical protein